MKSGGPRGQRTAALEQIDRLIGRNIRIHRLVANMSWSKLSRAIGVSEQQLQKYGAGTDRVAASRLCQIAFILGTRAGMLVAGLRRSSAAFDESRRTCIVGRV